MTDDLERVYAHRFADAEHASKEQIWQPIVAYLRRYFVDGPVLDLASDRGYFIRHVTGAERWATDLRDVHGSLPPDVHFVQGDGLALGELLPAAHFGVAFMSNYLEHLQSPEAVVEQLRVVHSLLRPGGRVIVLQPNIRLLRGSYWDFIDHKVPLTERSLEEAGVAVGFRTQALITRFLPYTTKSRLPKSKLLVRLYLATPVAWRIMGKQTLYVGEKRL
jgi:SAM-dependent methyltransferase